MYFLYTKVIYLSVTSVTHYNRDSEIVLFTPRK